MASEAALIVDARASNSRVAEIPPQRLAANLVASARALGISRDAYLGLARRCPPLLYLTPARIERRAADIRTLFHLNAKQLRLVVRRRPSILTYSAKRLYGNALKLMRDVGVPQKRLATVVVRCPQLLTLKPNELAAKARTLAAVLECTEREARRLIGAWPALLVYSPETLTRNLERSAEALDLPVDVYRRLVLRHPPSLTRRPATRVPLKAELIALSEACGRPMTIQEILTKAPAALSYSVPHVRLKILVRTLALAEYSLPRMLSLPKAQAVNRLRSFAQRQENGKDLWRQWRREGLVDGWFVPKRRRRGISSGK